MIVNSQCQKPAENPSASTEEWQALGYTIPHTKQNTQWNGASHKKINQTAGREDIWMLRMEGKQNTKVNYKNVIKRYGEMTWLP